MGRQVIEYQIGVDKKKGLIALKFPAPTLNLVMPAVNALELARELILCARDCEEQRKLDEMIKEIERSIQ